MNIKVNKYKDLCSMTVGKRYVSATQLLKWTAVYASCTYF